MRKLRSVWPTGSCVFFAILMAVLPMKLAAQNTLTDSDKDRILKRLEELQTTNLEARFGRFASAMAAFQAAAESPAKAYEFYMDCYKVVNYDQKGLKASEYREWKARNLKRVRETSNATMLQFQLRYLVMTIRAVHMEDTSVMIEPLMGYIQDAIGKKKLMGDNFSKLEQNVTNTIFSRAFEIEKTLNVGEEVRWSLSPMNVSAHYQTVIFPRLREEGDTKGLERSWDGLIALQIALLEDVEDEIRQKDFVEDTLPAMRWAKWSDVAENGERARGALQLLTVIESNMGHQRAGDWIKQLVGIVEGGTLSDDDFATD